jgi:hypothetical protein
MDASAINLFMALFQYNINDINIMTSNRKIHEEEEEEFNGSKKFEPGLNTLGSESTGNLLYHIHSTYFKPILFSKEETSLYFYEHVGE